MDVSREKNKELLKKLAEKQSALHAGMPRNLFRGGADGAFWIGKEREREIRE